MGKTPYSGIGCIFGAPVDASGTLLGPLRKLGNVYPLSLQVQTEQKKQTSRMCDTAGQTLATKTQLADTIGSMTLRQWDARALAWALSGEEVELSETGGSVTDENVTALGAGDYAPLANSNVSSVVVKDETDTTTYEEGTDYLLNANLGLLTIIESGGISKDDVLHVSYTNDARSGYRVNIGSKTLIRIAIKGDLENEYTGDKMAMDLYSVVLASAAEINFISEPDSEYEELPFTLSFETPAGKSSPGTIDGMTL